MEWQPSEGNETSISTCNIIVSQNRTRHNSKLDQIISTNTESMKNSDARTQYLS